MNCEESPSVPLQGRIERLPSPRTFGVAGVPLENTIFEGMESTLRAVTVLPQLWNASRRIEGEACCVARPKPRTAPSGR